MIIVEDGTIVPNANSYVSMADADAYLANSLNSDDWDALVDDEKEKLLIAATRWLNQRTRWAGCLVSPTQPLAWPRRGAVDCENLPVAENVVPAPVIAAVCELAVFFSKPENNPLRYADEFGLEQITVDVITLKFQEGYNPNSKRSLPGINDILCSLGRVSTATGRGFAPINKV